MVKRTRRSYFIKRVRQSIYTFPLVVLAAFFVLTAMNINGSSIGTYHSIVYGTNTKDPDLLYGHPRNIRSDEYLAGTPLTTLQYKTGFPKFNKALGSGRNVALLPDVPTSNWTTLFRPQNWSFFVLPFEYAFAFRWWLGPVLVIIAAYFFCLRTLKDKKLAILLSTAFGISPFLLWWYQSTLFIPMAYSFLLLLIGMRIIKQEKVPFLKSAAMANIFYVLALSYIGASFILFLYPPFLIPLLIVVTAFLVGYLLNERFTNRTVSTKSALRRLGLMLLPVLIIAPIIALFTLENIDIIHAVASSEYPGHRTVQSGGMPYSPLFPIFGSYLVPFLQSGVRAVHYYTNQSEASNFILLLPFLIIPGIYLQIDQYRKSKTINFVFLSIQLVAIMFLLRISVHFGDGFYNLMLLDKVPHNRLLAGVGLVGFLQLMYMYKLLPDLKIRAHLRSVLAIAYGVACLVILLLFAVYARSKYPLFLDDLRYPAIILAVAFTCILTVLLAKKYLLSAYLLLGFTCISSFAIIPLYRGLGFLKHSEIVKKIESVSGPTDHWAVVDNFTFENLPWAAGRGLINGVQIYSDIDFWRQLDTTGQFEHVYNRQAHALFVSNTVEPNKYFRGSFATISKDIEIVKGNVFKVKFACSKFIYNNVDYVLTTHKPGLPCLTLVDKVDYPELSFYIYKIKQVY